MEGARALGKETLPPVVVLFGPTASGKSALAMEFARHVAGLGKRAVIINADSRQIYKQMPIWSTCPTAADYAEVRHELFEFLAPTERFSAGAYAARAEGVIRAALVQGAVPVVVGGTGFYVRALMEGLPAMPAVGEEVLATVRGEPLAEVWAELQRVDPELAAKLRPSDTQRIVRGVAVWRATRRRLSAWQTEPRVAPVGLRFVRVGLLPPRAVLHARLAERWEKVMLPRGVVAEIAALRAAGLTPGLPALGGLALPVFFEHVAGRVSLADALRAAQKEDRAYVKRQTTWLRHQFQPEVLLSEANLALLLDELRARGVVWER